MDALALAVPDAERKGAAAGATVGYVELGVASVVVDGEVVEDDVLVVSGGTTLVQGAFPVVLAPVHRDAAGGFTRLSGRGVQEESQSEEEGQEEDRSSVLGSHGYGFLNF